MTLFQRTGLLSAFGILLLFTAFSTAAVGQASADSREITNLLSTVKVHAMHAETDAATLESYTHSTVSWESHARRLNQIKEHVNDLINDYNEMKRLRESGSPWQQEAIDRIEPLVQEMSTHLTATIQHLNDNQSRVHMPPFRDYVKANHVLISKTHEIIDDFVDYSDSKARADSLEEKLELPAAASQGN